MSDTIELKIQAILEKVEATKKARDNDILVVIEKYKDTFRAITQEVINLITAHLDAKTNGLELNEEVRQEIRMDELLKIATETGFYKIIKPIFELKNNSIKKDH